MLLAQLKLELDHLDMRIDEADTMIKKTARENEACQRLFAILADCTLSNNNSIRSRNATHKARLHL